VCGFARDSIFSAAWAPFSATPQSHNCQAAVVVQAAHRCSLAPPHCDDWRFRGREERPSAAISESVLSDSKRLRRDFRVAVTRNRLLVLRVARRWGVHFRPRLNLYNTFGAFFCPSWFRSSCCKASEGLAPFVALDPRFLSASFSRHPSAASLEMSGCEGARPRPRLRELRTRPDRAMRRPQEKNARFFEPERVSSLFSGRAPALRSRSVCNDCPCRAYPFGPPFFRGGTAVRSRSSARLDPAVVANIA
jgi:hypothetical protein